MQKLFYVMVACAPIIFFVLLEFRHGQRGLLSWRENMMFLVVVLAVALGGVSIAKQADKWLFIEPVVFVEYVGISR